MSPEQAMLDPKKVEEFLGKAISDVAATFHAGLVLIGDKLGLYRAMAGAGPMSPADLARRTGAHERYVREWLSAQAAGGYVTYDPATGRFTLPPEQAFLLLDADLPGAFQLSIGSVRDEPKISDAFRTGAGVGWHEHDAGVYEGCERFFRPGYLNHLADTWIPALDGVEAKLSAGARIADVGCEWNPAGVSGQVRWHPSSDRDVIKGLTLNTISLLCGTYPGCFQVETPLMPLLSFPEPILMSCESRLLTTY